MSADLLRRTAAKLRETAANATPGPWVTGGKTGYFPNLVGPAHGGAMVETDDDDAAWIALMHPGIAEPLAIWLESVAERWTPAHSWEQSYAVAIALDLLGEP